MPRHLPVGWRTPGSRANGATGAAADWHLGARRRRFMAELMAGTSSSSTTSTPAGAGRRSPPAAGAPPSRLSTPPLPPPFSPVARPRRRLQHPRHRLDRADVCNMLSSESRTEDDVIVQPVGRGLPRLSRSGLRPPPHSDMLTMPCTPQRPTSAAAGFSRGRADAQARQCLG